MEGVYWPLYGLPRETCFYQKLLEKRKLPFVRLSEDASLPRWDYSVVSYFKRGLIVSLTHAFGHVTRNPLALFICFSYVSLKVAWILGQDSRCSRKPLTDV